jgi:hypothetical protein
MATVATATDDQVFEGFALGYALEGDTARSTGVGMASALYSHGVLLALRSEECVVFDARPCHDGERCVCAYMKAIGRAGVFAHTHYDDDEVCSLDHGAFVDLARRLGAIL